MAFSDILHLSIFAAFIGVICAFLCGLIQFVKRKYVDYGFCIYVFLCSAYVLMAFIILFKPYNYKGDMDLTLINFINLEAFKTISIYIQDQNYIPIIGNIIITLPLFPLSYVLLNRFVSMKKCFLILLILILIIEPLQLTIDIITMYPNKVVDIDDFILNLSGYLIGFILTALIYKSCLIKLRNSTGVTNL